MANQSASIGQPRIAANAPVLDPAKLAETTALYGPQGAQYVQQSQMLARALEAMRDQSQNIRTPVALASDLLAETLLNAKYGKTNAALTDAYANQQRAAQNIERQQLGMPTLDTESGSPAPGSQSNPVSPLGEPQDPGYAPDGRPGPLQIGNAPQGTPTPSNPLPRVDGAPGGSATGSTVQPSAADTAMLLRTAGSGGPYASIGPVSPAADQLAAALAGHGSGAAQGSAPGGTDASAPDYAPNFGDPHQDPAAFFAAALGGKPVTITSGLRTPQQNAAVGGSPTSSHLTGNAWDFTVPGMTSAQTVDALRQSGMPFDQIIDEGRNVHVGMDPRMRGMVMAGSAGNYRVLDHDTFGAPQPSSAGMTPGGAPAPVSSSPPQAVAQPPSPAGPQPLAGSGAPGGQMWRIVDQPPAGSQWNIRNGIAYGPAPNDEEKRQVQALWANPMTKAQGDALAQQIIQRQRTPITYKQEISRDGQILATPEIPGTGPTYLGEAPGYTLPAEARIARQSDGSYGPVQGATYGPAGERPGMTGQYQTDPAGKQVKVGERPYGAPQGVPGAQGQFQQAPNGRMEQVAGPIVSVDQLMSARNTTRSSPQVATYYSTVSGLDSMKRMIDAATQPNGVISMELIDRLTNMGAGGVATPAKVNLMLEHLGFPQEVAGHLTSLIGQGPITPETIHQLYNAGVAYATTQQKLAQQRVDEDAAFVKKNTGQELGITLPELPGSPTAQWFSGGQGGPPQPQGAPAPTPSLAAPQQTSRSMPQGARRAPDGNWYVPDPNRPGKYLKVVQ